MNTEVISLNIPVLRKPSYCWRQHKRYLFNSSKRKNSERFIWTKQLDFINFKCISLWNVLTIRDKGKCLGCEAPGIFSGTAVK